MTVTVPPANGVDPAEVLPTLVAAFVDDPVWRWLYPDRATYERAFPDFLLLAARSGFEAGTVDRSPDGHAAAVWSPPGVEMDPEELEARWLTHFQTHCEPSRMGDIFAWSEQFGRHHPTDPHWYLGAIGVVPARQGRGYGSALLSVGLERCDRDGLPAYLEASTSRSRVVYERHGFEVIGEIQAGDSPSVWPMLRPPVTT